MMRPIAHQVHQPNRARLLPAERKARMEVEDTDRPGRPGRIGTHACGSSAAHASIAARASALSIVGAWPTTGTPTSRAPGHSAAIFSHARRANMYDSSHRRKDRTRTRVN